MYLTGDVSRWKYSCTYTQTKQVKIFLHVHTNTANHPETGTLLGACCPVGMLPQEKLGIEHSKTRMYKILFKSRYMFLKFIMSDYNKL